MEFLSALSDDQKALLGCITALSCTGLLLMISNFIGKSRSRSDESHAPTILLKKEQPKVPSKKEAA